jgi:hypothetical protein
MDKALEALQWHWGDAYLIANPEPGVWVAARRDDHATLRGETPEVLRDKIIADYTARHVPRDPPRRMPLLG